jgi:4-alpha-glucanotransferase
VRSGGSTARRLADLAQIHGIQLGYTAQDGKRVKATTETLVAVLAALGHAVDTERDIDAELERVRAEQRDAVVQPVVVVGRNGLLSSQLTVDPRRDLSGCWLVVEREDGRVERRPLDEVSTVAWPAAEDRALEMPVDVSSLALPPGYHRLTLDGLGDGASALLLVPPPKPSIRRGGFGLFAPLYALRSNADWGIGSFSDLAGFSDRTAELGGEFVGTLPLYAGFFREPVDPSPYLPVSRMFWNEIFIDPTVLPELAASPEAAGLVGSPQFRSELAALRRADRVDHGAVMRLKRQVLELCADALMSQPSVRRDEFEVFVKSHPSLERYAEFRAADEALGPWSSWDRPPGALPRAELDATAVRFHRYVQFVAEEQLAVASEAGAGLYLDLPVGVHPHGFDTWSNDDLFGAAGVGAPPDKFFAGGQSWGFPPLHPRRMREDGYRYLIEAYRHVMRHARAVRIDHVLGLQRLFWIPQGSGADGGAYVCYRSEELRAIIGIEAERSGTVVVGEDLGTVSPGIRRAMDLDGMLHTFVYQFEAAPDNPFPQPQRPSMASLGSHDLPRFATFWRGTDIDDRKARGEIGAETARRERAERQALTRAAGGRRTAAAALRSCLVNLARGPAAYLSIDLGDLIGETVQDNRPGTGPEAGNWQHRLSQPVDDIAATPAVRNLLDEVRAARPATADEEVTR